MTGLADSNLVLGLVFVALVVAASTVLAFLILLPVSWFRRRRWRKQAAADRRLMREMRERARTERIDRRRRLGRPEEPWL